MNFDIIKMEYKKFIRLILIWISIVVSYSVFIMLVYISFSGSMNKILDILDDPSLQGFAKAFSMDKNTFSYILSYYTSYSSIYTILFGCIFASILTGHLFAKEVRDGTYEFTYSAPISRTKFFINKAFVAFSFVIILNLALFFTGFVMLEIISERSPRVVWLTGENNTKIQAAINEKKDKFREVFILDEKLFYNVLYNSVSDEMISIDEETKANLNISDEDIQNMLSSFLQGPEAYLKSIKENPDQYMKMFNIPIEEKDSFIEKINKELDEFYYIKENFGNDPQIYLEFFSKNPKPFLDQLIDKKRLGIFKTAYGFTEDEIDDIFIYYSLKNYIILSISVLLIMLSIMSINLLLSVLIKRGRFSTGIAVGLSLLFYFTDMAANLSEHLEFLKYFTPFSYKNLAVMEVNYGIEGWMLVVQITLISICTIASGIVFKRNDLVK
ncbi:ABC transporter permease subunit [Wukongibacter sp. M2B1]|uniref:ABC transporter permease subunit n=1 Tax=Wukongibacter sp. M2B1 TaxID=3088895 RepID=UPI003D7B8B65